jgi:putative ABC transport system permease protein
MFKNYLKLALRNLWKNKSFSTLNILGLGLGMACSLLIILWVSDELRVDSFHANGSRLFSVYERQYFDGKIVAFHSTPGVLPDEMKRVIPEISIPILRDN